MRKYLPYIIFVLVLCVSVKVFVQAKRIETLTDERNRYRNNVETLMADCQEYQIRDSLQAARVGSLELTVREFEKFRVQDAALIKDLTGRNRDLEQLNKAQAQTIIRLQDIPRDTVILIDSIPVRAKAIHCGDAWYDFDGLMTEADFSGTLVNRESLILTETVKYKRFLFWKTRKVKDRQMDAVSLNPHTTITGLEYIIIDR